MTANLLVNSFIVVTIIGFGATVWLFIVFGPVMFLYSVFAR